MRWTVARTRPSSVAQRPRLHEFGSSASAPLVDNDQGAPAEAARRIVEGGLPDPGEPV